MSVKRDKFDAVFSDLVRERADYTCEHCAKMAHPPSRSMHCAHIHGRRARSTRWDTDNAVCLCAGCHFHFTDHPTLFTRWLEKYLGEGHLEVLREKATEPRNWSRAEKDELYQHLRSELERIRQLRMDGVIGYIDVTSY